MAKNRISENHRLIAQAMGVPQASVEAERLLTKAAREGAGQSAPQYAGLSSLTARSAE